MMVSRQRARLLQGRLAWRTWTCKGVTDNIPAINNVQVEIGPRHHLRGSAPPRAGGLHRQRHAQRASSRAWTRSARRSQIEGNPYEVVGVAKALGSVFGNSQDNFVMIPIESYFKTYGSRTGIRMVAKAIDQEHLAEARGRSARAAARLPPPAARARTTTSAIFASETIVSLWERLTAAIAGMAVGIVSVFMVVGGIVIMNIMLAVVTERTHEIGIRKSLGARRRDILNQYLVESSVLAGAGGLAGVCVAWVLAVLVRSFTSVPMALPWSSVVIGVGLSAMVGLFFGIYPARQAPPSWTPSKPCGWRSNA